MPGLYRLSPGVIDAQKKFFSPMLFVGQQPNKFIVLNYSYRYWKSVWREFGRFYFTMDSLITNLISSMTLALPIALLVAVRAGQMIELRLASLLIPYHKSYFIPGLLF